MLLIKKIKMKIHFFQSDFLSPLKNEICPIKKQAPRREPAKTKPN